MANSEFFLQSHHSTKEVKKIKGYLWRENVCHLSILEICIIIFLKTNKLIPWYPTYQQVYTIRYRKKEY